MKKLALFIALILTVICSFSADARLAKTENTTVGETTLISAHPKHVQHHHKHKHHKHRKHK